MSETPTPDVPGDPRAPFLGLLMRYRFVWTGGAVGTGYTTLFGMGTAAQAFADGAYALMSSCIGSGAGSNTGGGITVTPDGFVDILDVPTGELTESQGVTASSALVSASTARYAGPAGLCITWTTSGVVNGKRVRGRTFIVPTIEARYDTNGTVLDSYRTTCLTAAGAYRVGSWAPAIYHRPKDKVGGAAYAIAGHGIRDRISILTSRR